MREEKDRQDGMYAEFQDYILEEDKQHAREEAGKQGDVKEEDKQHVREDVDLHIGPEDKGG